MRSLRDAGAIILGKTTCSELVVWPFTETPAWGATRNPWNTEFSPGGSSGGSGAAVAAGLCGLATGSDGLGSIRVPASFTGVIGLKPHHGRVWTAEHDWNGLSSNGPLTRTVNDAALFLDVTASNGPSGGYRAAAADSPGRLSVALALDPPARWPMAARPGDAQRWAVELTADVLRDRGHTVTEHEVGFPAVAANRTLYESGRRIPHFAPWNATGQPAISIPAGFSELSQPAVGAAGRTTPRRSHAAPAGPTTGSSPAMGPAQTTPPDVTAQGQ